MNTTLEIHERQAAIADDQAMRDVMALLDEWQAPEVSPWFDGRMMARFREEQQRTPEGWLARVRNRFHFGEAIGYKPLLAGAMALVLVAGGGSYLGFAHSSAPARTSATLQDLQVIDNNAQALQQMDQLLDNQDDNGSNGSSL